MLKSTYQKIVKLFQENNGYVNAALLKKEKVTTVQIKELLQNGTIEKVSHGHYWLVSEEGKPENYKLLETCQTNPKAVICADSACYYHGLIKEEPEKLSIATAKTDRSRMQLPFPVCRHYYSDVAFEQDLQIIETPYGKIRVYGLERSVCDSIRFQENIGEENVTEIVENYMKQDKKELERLQAYADAMRVGKIVRTRLEKASKACKKQEEETSKKSK
ncbi:MAG: hypothetical protein SO170_08135 [Butyribacter sp.]|nr:hypothetical protein [bacterium]MDY3854903.1 hypothetical protein [Butyribacter sp.]